MSDFNDVSFTLGKTVTSYQSTYNPKLLARHPRSINREKYSIDDSSIFVGFDSWHAYEETFLLENGQPITFILKIKVSASSKYLVESKSLKLYLYSYAMERIPGTKEQAIATYKIMVEKDLSELLESNVQVQVFEQKDYTTEKDAILNSATPLEDLIDFSKLTFETLGEDPTLLQVSQSLKEIHIKSDMLRSKCLITGQPDTGTVFIYMKGDVPTLESLAKYIFSLREEHHFHEEIVECFYKRLLDMFKPEQLMVAALYNRRGGIDICPVRANNPALLPLYLGKVTALTEKEYRQ